MVTQDMKSFGVMENNETVQKKLNVFVVDDDDLVRRAVMRTLRRIDLPLNFHDFDSAKALLDEIEHTGEIPSVVISDYEMPGMKGDELCQKLQTMKINGNHPPMVMILTGAYTDLLAERLSELGATCVYSKPFTLNIRDEIVQRIKLLIPKD